MCVRKHARRAAKPLTGGVQGPALGPLVGSRGQRPRKLLDFRVFKWLREFCELFLQVVGLHEHIRSTTSSNYFSHLGLVCSISVVIRPPSYYYTLMLYRHLEVDAQYWRNLAGKNPPRSTKAIVVMRRYSVAIFILIPALHC